MLIREAAVRVARHHWVEQRLFQVLGTWSLATDDVDVDVAMAWAAQSHHHAWHASLWEERLPVLHDLGPDQLGPSPALVALLDAFAEPIGVIERLVGVTRVVVPDLLAHYDADRSAATAVADAPMLRALALVIADEQADLRASVVLLTERLRNQDDVARATAHQSYLEHLLAAAGG